jgi:hypothetical protein
MSYIKEQLKELSDKNFVFVPNTYNFLILTSYILNKYDIELLLPSKYMLKNHIKNFRDLFIHWNCGSNERGSNERDGNERGSNLRKLDIPKFYKNKIKKFIENKDERFLVFPLILHDKLKCNETPQTSKITHTNIIIYDKLNKSLERFDPSNTTYYESDKIDLDLFNVFTDKFNLKIEKQYSPTSICLQKKGIQGLQEDEVYSNKIKVILGGNVGFCTMYSLLYLDMRLKYKKGLDSVYEPSDIIKMIIKKAERKGISLTKMIVDYTYNLQQITKYVEDELQNKDQIKFIYQYEEEEKKLKKNKMSEDDISKILLKKFGKTNSEILQIIFSSIKKYFNLKRNEIINNRNILSFL